MLKKINELKREKAIKKITGNLGYVIGDGDRLICYVKRERIFKQDRFPNELYVISLRDYKKENMDLVEKYDLNKEIVYVLDGLTFGKREPVVIEDYDNIFEVEIKNCRFDDGLAISKPKKCTIRNTVSSNDYFISENIIKADELIMDNVGININDRVHLLNEVTICASNLLKIMNSQIKADTCRIGSIKTKKLCIENSTLEARSNIYINARNLISKNSKAISNHRINVFVKFYDKACGLLLNASYIYVNDVLLRKEDNGVSIYLRPLNDLDKQRKVLINCLKEIKDNFEEKRDETLIRVKENYNSQPVGKVLLRGKDR